MSNSRRFKTMKDIERYMVGDKKNFSMSILDEYISSYLKGKLNKFKERYQYLDSQGTLSNAEDFEKEQLIKKRPWVAEDDFPEHLINVKQWKLNNATYLREFFYAQVKSLFLEAQYEMSFGKPEKINTWKIEMSEIKSLFPSI